MRREQCWHTVAVGSRDRQSNQHVDDSFLEARREILARGRRAPASLLRKFTTAVFAPLKLKIHRRAPHMRAWNLNRLAMSSR